MKKIIYPISMGLCSALLALAIAPPSLYSQSGVVAADHILASQAGAQILRQGGNAVDAVISTTLAAGVVQPVGSGLGGGGFAVVHKVDNAPFVLDFRERASTKASRDMFVNQSREKASQKGGLAVAIPNEGNGLIELYKKYSSLPLSVIAKPAIELASKGFTIESHLLHALGKLPSTEREAISLQLWDIRNPEHGSQLKNVKLAKTIKAWAKTEGQVYKDGWVAQDIADVVQKDKGIVSLEDLEQVTPKQREALEGMYKDWHIITMPPPSSGGLIILQILAVLEGYDLASMGHNSSELLHLYAETMKHAYADRANYMGDPDRVEVPITRILDTKRIEEIRSQYSPEKTQTREYYGTPKELGTDAGTQHISVIDKNGMSVALTSTINTEFGSMLVAPKSGILLNNQMDDFVAKPGTANYYGLIGSEANSVAPMAVPLSSMSPTILYKDSGEQIVVGASGGPLIISSTIQVILNIVEFGMSPSEAVHASRIHHQWVPEKLFLDGDIPKDVRDNLEKKGHTLASMPLQASVQVIHCSEEGCLAASDPRKGGWPVAR